MSSFLPPPSLGAFGPLGLGAFGLLGFWAFMPLKSHSAPNQRSI